jgi:hypothetical protein
LASSLFRPRRFAPANGGVFLTTHSSRLVSGATFRPAQGFANEDSAGSYAVAFRGTPVLLPHRKDVIFGRRSLSMLSHECTRELKAYWLPNISDCGLDRLIDMLEKGSPLLVHGCFTKTVPMGCLASHVAWNHPQTNHLTHDAGIMWLYRVAGLNPATSSVIREWDAKGSHSWELRSGLLEQFKNERDRRQNEDLVEESCEYLVGV